MVTYHSSDRRGSGGYAATTRKRDYRCTMCGVKFQAPRKPVTCTAGHYAVEVRPKPKEVR